MPDQALVTPGPYVARTAEYITQMLIDYFVMSQTEVTDLSVGSVIRTEFEALGELAEQFYTDQATELQDAIIQSAYTAFNFTQLPYANSTGYLVFKVEFTPLIDTTFQVGTAWQPVGLDFSFQTTTTFTIPAGSLANTYWHVPARCTTPGIVGNIEPGVPGDLLYPSPGIQVFSEDGSDVIGTIIGGGSGFPLQQGFVNGVDPETPLEMRTRFTSFLSSLHRSTPDALEYGASLGKVYNVNGDVTEQVALSKTIDFNNDNPNPPNSSLAPIYMPTAYSTLWPCNVEGDVRIFIYNGVGSPNGQITSTFLQSAAQDIIDGSTTASGYVPGYKAAGMPTYVQVADEYIVTPTIRITSVGSGTSTAVSADFLKEAIAGPGGAIDNYFRSLSIGSKYYISGLIGAISQVPGVQAVTILSQIIKRQPDNATVISSVVDYQPPLNGVAIPANLNTIRTLLTVV